MAECINIIGDSLMRINISIVECMRSWYKAHLWGYAREGGDSRNIRGRCFWEEERVYRY